MSESIGLDGAKAVTTDFRKIWPDTTGEQWNTIQHVIKIYDRQTAYRVLGLAAERWPHRAPTGPELEYLFDLHGPKIGKRAIQQIREMLAKQEAMPK